MRILSSLSTDVTSKGSKVFTIAYDLFFDSDSYGLDCYVKGSDDYNIIVNDISKSQEAAEFIQNLLCQKQVFPVHINDVINEMLN